ncbi:MULTISPECIES: hypothetical protein [Mycobacteroides]|uniref:Uncharacterized protein n=1 Tax=Mycobacteroides franklinii TaxID=948102 RepID=A0A4R5PEK1_9MYCO|nr:MULTISPECIES: hypothetical protein [Mycobacteroides]MBV6362531.1 hypothetical protein [Mycobacteroides chelonae]ORA64155.1 hypothetical protein BST24_03080 [Mycobacteroides franklinii]TDH23874.1 hypothetical protein EJ571_06450 [Mycobacteroides franklinii]
MSTTPFTPVLTPGLTPDVTVREDPRAAAAKRIEEREALLASIPQRAQARLDYWEDRDNYSKGINNTPYLSSRPDRGVLKQVVDSATFLAEEPPLLIYKRMEALVAHVAQLAVAQSAGSEVSVAAVINVSRVAFPQVLHESGDGELDRLIDIGVAGMMVMRNVDTTCWYESRRDQFGDGVRKSWEYSFVFRPDELKWAGSHGAIDALTLK